MALIYWQSQREIPCFRGTWERCGVDQHIYIKDAANLL
jgi:hypothetical protein